MSPPRGTNCFERGILWFLALLLSPQTRAICRVYWGHYRNFPLFFVFIIVRSVWVAVQWLYWKLIGFRPLEYPYEESAQVLDVMWTVKPCPIDESRPQYYILKHNRMTHPQYVLSDNCMILRVWREYTMFVDFGKPVQDNFTVATTPFLWDETIHYAQRIIIMATSSLHKVSMHIAHKDRIENRGDDLSLLFGTGRCGSTLITRIVETADKNCLVLSEPVHLIDLYRYYSRIPSTEFDMLLLSSTRLICKPLHNNPSMRKIFIKPLCFCLPLARAFKKLVPGVRTLFCHRDPLKTSWAHERAFGMTICYRAYQMAQWVRQLHMFEQMFRYHRNPKVDDVGYVTMPYVSMLEMCLQAWAAHYLSWKEQKEEFDFPEIYYDDVFKEPVKFVRLVLEVSGYTEVEVNKLLPLALKALDIDSQSGKEIGQKQLQGYPVTKVTPYIGDRINLFCDTLDIPRPASFVSNYSKQKPPNQSDNVYESLLKSLNGSTGDSHNDEQKSAAKDFLSQDKNGVKREEDYIINGLVNGFSS